MDTILIEALRVDALVGVYPHEREATQPLLLHIALHHDNRVPAASDDMADGIDYAGVCRHVRALVARHQPKLLETLAETIADDLLRLPRVRGVRVRIGKPAAAAALDVGMVSVEIERTHARSGASA